MAVILDLAQSAAHGRCGTMPRMGKNAEDRLARLATSRLARELETIRAMLRIACRDHHGTAEGLCAECAALADYAAKRLALCPYGADKPTCVNCRIHCYGPRQREQVREMMRYAGPRMMLRHPLLAIMHVVDGRRPAPPKPSEALAEAAASSGEAAKPVTAEASESRS
jgi:hypothetical protein